ncbi:VOC family protein [Phyllobacterium endophyticum]|nr:VOC family protein [Phyllobacterium endophyticum]MBB3236840.1 catechol 2,3-dioxygenase-like lactoylglutathione lyase family enzyme [Phyllobacterium endophyticum]
MKPQHERAVEFFGVLLNVVRVDNVDIVIFARPTPDNGNQFAGKELWPEDGFRPTEGSVINHLAFSYVAAGSALTRIKNAGVPIVQELQIDPRHGHTSFYVRGPDGLLIEIVEDRPIPAGNWSKK